MAYGALAAVKERLERYFEFQRLRTDWRTEVLAGFTTFATMAYILFVNPAILAEAGMPVEAVTAATCLSAAFGSLLMGAIARYPIALAPGMGLNAYFAYTVVKGMGIPWQEALGAVFLSGILFLVLTISGLRQKILEAMPRDLFAAISAGIGLFIAFIGLRNAGLIVQNPATTVAIGDLRNATVLLSLFGLLLIAGLLAWNVRAAILIGIVVTTLLALLLGQVQWTPGIFDARALLATAGQLDVAGVLRRGALEIVFVFFFVDLFDNIGTLVGVGTKARLFEENQQIPRLKRIFLTDSLATIFGSLTGTSTVVSYIESAAGVAAGGRSGVTAVVVGLLFLVAVVLAPLAGVIPPAATAPALIIVGSMMLSQVASIDWEDAVRAIPSFLTIVMIPLTFSIANGLAFGFITYTFMRFLRGEWREIGWMVYTLTALFVLRFAYMAGH